MKTTIKIFIILVLTSFLLPTIAQTNTEIDSLINVLETMPEDTSKAILLYEISEKFNNKDSEKQKYYANKCLELSKKLNFHKGLIKSYYNLALYFNTKGKHETALKNINFAIRNAQKYKADTIALLQLRGDINLYKVNYQNALNDYIVILQFFEKEENNEKIASLNHRIGTVLLNMRKDNEALSYFNKAYKVFSKSSNYRGMAVCLTSIGGINAYKHNYEKSIKTYLSVIELYRTSKADTMSYANIYYHIATVYSDTKKYNLALQYFEKSLSICDNVGNLQYSTAILEEIAIINMRQENYVKAINISKRSLKISNKFDRNQTYFKPYQTIGLSYIGLLNKDSAFYYLNKWQVLRDSLFSIKNQEIITELQTKYETEKKVQEIITLKNESKIKQLELKKQENIRNYTILISLIIIIFSTVYFYNKKQKNEKLAQINLELTKNENKILKLNLDEENNKAHKHEINDNKKINILAGLNELLNVEKIYKQQNLTIEQLSKKMNTNRTYISEIIKDEYKMNFNTFLKRRRIEEARNILSNPKNNYTIYAISSDLGFGSESSFYKAFKSITGITPTVFRKNACKK